MDERINFKKNLNIIYNNINVKFFFIIVILVILLNKSPKIIHSTLGRSLIMRHIIQQVGDLFFFSVDQHVIIYVSYLFSYQNL